MTTPPKKTPKKISVQEIKFWLEGILEFQTNDWVPNAQQWKTVKEKIMSLRDDPREAPQPTKPINTPEPTRALTYDRAPVFADAPPAGPSSLRLPPRPNVEDGEYNNPFA